MIDINEIFRKKKKKNWPVKVRGTFWSSKLKIAKIHFFVEIFKTKN